MAGPANARLATQDPVQMASTVETHNGAHQVNYPRRNGLMLNLCLLITTIVVFIQFYWPLLLGMK